MEYSLISCFVHMTTQVLDEGKVVEFDEPCILLQDAGGLFSKMVSETGSAESVKLIATARRGKHVQLRGLP